MRAVVFANTVYQLFLAINMKLQKVIQEETDLVISDHTPSLIRYLGTLQSSGLFRNVFYVESLHLVKEFWARPRDKQTEAFAKLAVDVNKGKISFSNYSTLFTANFNPYINAVFYSNRHLDVCFYEDGASVCAVDWRKSFQTFRSVTGFMDIFEHVSALYINSPELMCVDLGWPIVQLPKIAKNDPCVRKIYNHIFQYDGSFRFPPFVFVEQSFQVDKVINNDLEFMKTASEIVGYENFLVKTHPRNTVNRPVELGYSRDVDCTLPFELLLLNTQVDETVFITVSSTSLISPWVLFGERPKTILLYKAITGGINIPAIDSYDQYLDKFVEKYACRELMVPRDMTEFKKILSAMKRRMLIKEMVCNVGTLGFGHRSHL